MDPGESTVGYPVVFRSEGDVGAAAFVRAAVEPRLSPRVLVLEPWIQIFVVFWPVFGLMYVVLWVFRSFNQISIDGKKNVVEFIKMMTWVTQIEFVQLVER